MVARMMGSSYPDKTFVHQMGLEIPPELEKILVMIDKDGDENYQPMVIPNTGGYPAPAFGRFRVRSARSGYQKAFPR